MYVLQLYVFLTGFIYKAALAGYKLIEEAFRIRSAAARRELEGSGIMGACCQCWEEGPKHVVGEEEEIGGGKARDQRKMTT